ncbi:hypothetical protein [Bacillus sp. MRMR6]|uniref:hypothetical protein n=1 Tax=Bacillus sp. MRMR6 TaxID=1928617 RepID=UPI0009525416|nr:hypothetical protein [Bacillus sp. MRMR6]OLS39145.1 hypothetical protein BTR25_13515 [Bacillus sp. MRMR6]
MPHNTKAQKRDANYSKVEQFFNPTTDQYEVQEGSNGAAHVKLTGSNIPQGQEIPVKIAGADSSGGAVNTSIKEAQAIIPVDIQARLSQTIQTHSGAIIAPSNANSGAWIDVDGFDKVGVTMISDLANNNQVVQIHWSNDNTNQHGTEVFPSIALKEKPYITDIKARYCRLQLQNGDTAPHTMSAWLYLKS